MVNFTKKGAFVFNGKDLLNNTIPVENSEAATWADEVEGGLDLSILVASGSSTGAIIKTSLSSLNSDLAHDVSAMAWVVGDGTLGNDGIYQKQGASGSGSWTRVADLPYSVIQLNNTNAGTANAIQATTTINVPDAAYGALLVLNITVENTGPVSLSVNGETAKPVVTNTGAEIPSGYFTENMGALVIDDGTKYRLTTYGDATAIQAAAESILSQLTEKMLGSHVSDTAVDAFIAANSYTKLTGAIYFNETSNVWRYWDGDSWETLPYATVADGSITFQKLATNVARTRLLADATIYVRTDGNDSNDGSTNDASGAFLTIQAAVDMVLQDIDFAGHNLTIQVADGTYNAGVHVNGTHIGAGELRINGNISNPSNVQVNTPGTHCFHGSNKADFVVRGFKTVNSVAGKSHIYCSNSNILFGEWDFGSSDGAHVEANPSGYIGGFADYQITGDAQSHLHAPSLGSVIVIGHEGNSFTVTLVGTPNFSAYFIGVAAGMVTVPYTFITFVGAATGTRAYVHKLGVLDCLGDTSLTYLPGDQGIVEQSGGRYFGYESVFGARQATQLPSPTGPNAWNKYVVTDSSSITEGAAVTSGGNHVVIVTSNGSSWIIKEVIA